MENAGTRALNSGSARRAGLRDCETARLRDCETARLRKLPDAETQRLTERRRELRSCVGKRVVVPRQSPEPLPAQNPFLRFLSNVVTQSSASLRSSLRLCVRQFPPLCCPAVPKCPKFWSARSSAVPEVLPLEEILQPKLHLRDDFLHAAAHRHAARPRRRSAKGDPVRAVLREPGDRRETRCLDRVHKATDVL